MSIYTRLTQQGWVDWGEGTWVLDRQGRTSLLAKERFDGRPVEERLWDLFEDQGTADPDTDWRWGSSLGIIGNGLLAAMVGEAK